MIVNDTSGFTSITLLIRFPIILPVYIVYRMHKVERSMVKTNAMNTQGDKIQAILGGSEPFPAHSEHLPWLVSPTANKWTLS